MNVIPKIYDAREVVLRDYRSEHNPVILPSKLLSWVVQAETCVNQLVDANALRNSQVTEIVGRIEAMEAVVTKANDFTGWLLEVHPEVMNEYIKNREAAKKLVT